MNRETIKPLPTWSFEQLAIKEPGNTAGKKYMALLNKDFPHLGNSAFMQQDALDTKRGHAWDVISSWETTVKTTLLQCSLKETENNSSVPDNFQNQSVNEEF